MAHEGEWQSPWSQDQCVCDVVKEQGGSIYLIDITCLPGGEFDEELTPRSGIAGSGGIT